MLEEIKKMQGICNDEFDDIIKGYISSGLLDLKTIGVIESRLNEFDPIIRTAIKTYVLSFLDVKNAEMYAASYSLQKDKIRHIERYILE